MAVNELAKAGFVNVYNIVNGLEGEIVDNPGSVYFGKHKRNGWKNCGLPWTYSFNPDHVGGPQRIGRLKALDRAVDALSRCLPDAIITNKFSLG